MILKEEQRYLQKNNDTYIRTKTFTEEHRYLEKNKDTYKGTMILTEER